MDKNTDSLNLYEELIQIASSDYAWYFWSQGTDRTIKDLTGVEVNYQIKAKNVEIFLKNNQSYGVRSLEDAIVGAKKMGMDVVNWRKSTDEVPKVMISKFSDFEQLYDPNIGIYNKQRPWIINKSKSTTKGIKVVFEGHPRSRDKVDEGDIRNKNELLHKKHPDEHKCALKADGRVLKRHRRPIEAKPKKHICNEYDSEFLKELTIG
jgi:translation initiation factor IF-3